MRNGQILYLMSWTYLKKNFSEEESEAEMSVWEEIRETSRNSGHS